LKGALPSPELDQGFFSPQQGEARKPKKCPLDLLGEDILGLPQSKVYEAPPVVGLDVYSHVSSNALSKLEKPVTVPLSNLHQVYTLSWYASSSSHPEMMIANAPAGETASAVARPASWETLVTKDMSIDIRLRDTQGRWDTIKTVQEIGKVFSETKIKDGATLSFCTHVPDEKSIGVTRFRGEVRNQQWHISEVYPAVKEATLREALRLASEADAGLSVTGMDETIAKDCMELFNAEWGRIFKDNPPKLTGGTVTISEKDRSLLDLFLVFYFRQKYADVWSMNPIDPELREKVKRLAVKDALAANVILEGASGRKFTGASVDTLDAAAIEDCMQIEKEVLALGGKLIGELACTQFNKFVFRYYAMPDEYSRLVWYRGGAPMTMVEIITDFGDKGFLSTMRQAGGPEDPAKLRFITRMPKAAIADMYANHIERRETLKKDHGGFKPFDKTLLECARRFEAGIVSQS
jgi:hypothetical protein